MMRVASSSPATALAGASALKAMESIAKLGHRSLSSSLSLASRRQQQQQHRLHPSPSSSSSTDLLVLGCGVAGASAALKAASLGLHVTMLSSAKTIDDCNSWWAQGGIIYRSKDQDDADMLIQDVLHAGAGRCDLAAVRKLATEGPGRVEELLLRGPSTVPFDTEAKGSLALCLEASHSRARILHWRDQTGMAITSSMQRAAREHPLITILPNTTAIDFLTTASGSCAGAQVFSADDGAVRTIVAPATVLATGGLGDIYEHTSNPESARGDGFAMAQRAGAQLQNMEYVQFHPTTLYLPGQRRFLLTEALRGAGARLVDGTGRAFARDYHPHGELAPRDVVSRMIVSEMERQGKDCMYLDISHKDGDWIAQRFPGVHEHCLAQGLDMRRLPLPVVPAQHYFCGGVATDLHGATTVQGLYAAGEVACTGLHGANRLASTSLLEGLVWGCGIVEDLVARRADSEGASRSTLSRLEADIISSEMKDCALRITSQSLACENDKLAIQNDWNILRKTMWENVGVVRNTSGLEAAVNILADLTGAAEARWSASHPSLETMGLRNASQTAQSIARAAMANSTSVGTHYIEQEDDSSIAQEAIAS